MKTTMRFFAAMLLLFVMSIQSVGAQSIESQMISFFSSNNNLPYRTICRLAHPTNTFVSGSLYMIDNDIYVTINSEDSDGDYTLKIRIHKSGSRFDYIEKISDNDFPSAWTVTNILSIVANDIFKDYHSDTIAMIEDLYGERLRDMNAKQMTLAALTLLLWKY